MPIECSVKVLHRGLLPAAPRPSSAPGRASGMSEVTTEVACAPACSTIQSSAASRTLRHHARCGSSSRAWPQPEIGDERDDQPVSPGDAHHLVLHRTAHLHPQRFAASPNCRLPEMHNRAAMPAQPCHDKTNDTGFADAPRFPRRACRPAPARRLQTAPHRPRTSNAGRVPPAKPVAAVRPVAPANFPFNARPLLGTLGRRCGLVQRAMRPWSPPPPAAVGGKSSDLQLTDNKDGSFTATMRRPAPHAHADLRAAGRRYPRRGRRRQADQRLPLPLIHMPSTKPRMLPSGVLGPRVLHRAEGGDHRSRSSRSGRS